jgi:hypothetical protein
MDQSAAESSQASVPSSNAALAPAALIPAPTRREPCPTCGSPPVSTEMSTPHASSIDWVYAIGRIDARFPRISVDKEFLQAAARMPGTSGLNDTQLRHQVLSEDENNYLLRQLCWVFTVHGLDTYILTPRDSADLRLLAQTVRQDPGPGDLDIVIGMKGPPAPPHMCNGLVVPIVFFDQIYSFDRDALIKELPKPDTADAKTFHKAAANLFDQLRLLSENMGTSSGARACNYLTARYPRLYHAYAEALARDESLSAVDVRRSSLSGSREIVDVVFSFTNRRTDVVSKQFVRVDVSD